MQQMSYCFYSSINVLAAYRVQEENTMPYEAYNLKFVIGEAAKEVIDGHKDKCNGCASFYLSLVFILLVI